MKILLLNGSPKGEASNTLKLANSFIGGLQKNQSHEVEVVNISEVKIDYCTGCFSCWRKTPGECILKNDDMKPLLEKYISADMVIWSLPLYHFSMPAKIKTFMERLLPLHMPKIENNNGEIRHPYRYASSYKQKHILISTAGFCSFENNFEALIKQFELCHGDNFNYIICAEGELFRVPPMAKKCDEYLAHVKKAGEEYISTGTFTEETKNNLKQLIIPEKIFIEVANLSWGPTAILDSVTNKIFKK